MACFLLQGGVFVDIDAGLSAYPQAFGINDSAQIVGDYNYDRLGFLRNNDIITTILQGPARGINNFGQIVGSYVSTDGTTHGYALDNGALTTRDVPGATSTIPMFINDSPQIVGYVLVQRADGSGYDTLSTSTAPTPTRGKNGGKKH